MTRRAGGPDASPDTGATFAANMPLIELSGREGAYLRGIRRCVEMLEGDELCDSDEFTVPSAGRGGAPQNNAVLRALQDVVERGDGRELEGFCAALTEICAVSDNSGDWSRMFRNYADRRERLMRRRHRPLGERQAADSWEAAAATAAILARFAKQ